MGHRLRLIVEHLILWNLKTFENSCRMVVQHLKRKVQNQESFGFDNENDDYDDNFEENDDETCKYHDILVQIYPC